MATLPPYETTYGELERAEKRDNEDEGRYGTPPLIPPPTTRRELNRRESINDTRRERRSGGEGLSDPTTKRPFQSQHTGAIITICNQHGGSYRRAGPDPKNEVALRANGHY